MSTTPFMSLLLFIEEITSRHSYLFLTWILSRGISIIQRTTLYAEVECGMCHISWFEAGVAQN